MYRKKNSVLNMWPALVAMMVVACMVSVAMAQGSGSKHAGSTSKAEKAKQTEKAQVKAELNAEALKAIIDAKVPMLLLDARGESSQVIQGSVALEYDADEKTIRNIAADTNQLIVTYCGGPECPMSLMLANSLAKQGYTNVIRFTGGIETWTQAGFELNENKDSKGSATKKPSGSSSKSSGSGTR